MAKAYSRLADDKRWMLHFTHTGPCTVFPGRVQRENEQEFYITIVIIN